MLLITEFWLFFKRTGKNPSWAIVDLFFTPVSPYLTKLCRLLKKNPHTESSNYCAIRNHHNQLEESEKNPMHYTGSALSLLWYKYHWKCQTASRVNWFFIHPNINRWHYAGQTELDYLPCMVHFILVCNSSVQMADTHWTTTRSAHRYILYFIGENQKPSDDLWIVYWLTPMFRRSQTYHILKYHQLWH